MRPARASTAVERRKASAPEARRRMATFACVARAGPRRARQKAYAPFGAPPPSLFGAFGRAFLKRAANLRCQDASRERERVFNPPPRKWGRGPRVAWWRGPLTRSFRCRCRRNVDARAPPTALRHSRRFALAFFMFKNGGRRPPNAPSPLSRGGKVYPSARRRPIRRSSVAWSERSAAEGPLWRSGRVRAPRRAASAAARSRHCCSTRMKAVGVFFGHAGNRGRQFVDHDRRPKPSSGSSSNSSAGLVISAARSPAFVARRRRAGCRNCARRSASRGKRSYTAGRSQRPARAATVRFSSTVREGKISRSCATQPMPESARRCGGSAVMSSPRQRTRPRLTWV